MGETKPPATEGSLRIGALPTQLLSFSGKTLIFRDFRALPFRNLIVVGVIELPFWSRRRSACRTHRSQFQHDGYVHVGQNKAPFRSTNNSVRQRVRYRLWCFRHRPVSGLGGVLGRPRGSRRQAEIAGCALRQAPTGLTHNQESSTFRDQAAEKTANGGSDE